MFNFRERIIALIKKVFPTPPPPPKQVAVPRNPRMRAQYMKRVKQRKSDS